jgi:hypothetical protein
MPAIEARAAAAPTETIGQLRRAKRRVRYSQAVLARANRALREDSREIRPEIVGGRAATPWFLRERSQEDAVEILDHRAAEDLRRRGARLLHPRGQGRRIRLRDRAIESDGVRGIDVERSSPVSTRYRSTPERIHVGGRGHVPSAQLLRTRVLGRQPACGSSKPTRRGPSVRSA